MFDFQLDLNAKIAKKVRTFMIREGMWYRGPKLLAEKRVGFVISGKDNLEKMVREIRRIAAEAIDTEITGKVVITCEDGEILYPLQEAYLRNHQIFQQKFESDVPASFAGVKKLKEKKPTCCPECHARLKPNSKGVCGECGLIFID